MKKPRMYDPGPIEKSWKSSAIIPESRVQSHYRDTQ
jgi:hypothetical protein